MHYLLISFTIGNFSVAIWPQIPGVGVLAFCLLIALAFGSHPATRLPGLLLLGIVYGCFWGNLQLAGQLPKSLDKTDYLVTGLVKGLPETDSHRSRFLFLVDNVEMPELPAFSLKGKRLLLNWYGQRVLAPGQRYSLQVRLRSPRGFANPGGMDYSLWLLRNGISATGYVRSHSVGATGQASAVQTTDSGGNKPVINREQGLPAWRHELQTAINQLPQSPAIRGLLSALIVGNKSGIPTATWQDLVSTGTVHLAVVSGLHVGMAATFGYWCGLLLGRILLISGGIRCAKTLGLGVALAAALGYSLLSGFGLPAQRALVMLGVALVLLTIRRRVNPWQGLLWSCFVVSLLDPLAILTPGFWLSFVAVTGLMFWFVPRPGRAWPQQLVAAQVVVLIALAGCLLHFQGCLSLIQPLVNLVAVPWLSFLVIPLLLLGGLLFWIFPGAALFLWNLGGWQLEGFVSIIEYAANEFAHSQWQPLAASQWWFAPGATLGAFLLLTPAALTLRGAGAVLICAILLARPDYPEPLSISILDVGQGLAAVVRAGGKTLVYDTGPAFSSHFDAGSGIVAPFLRSLGIGQIDTLIISHGDSDHSGGFRGLLNHFDAARVLTSDPTLQHPGKDRCRTGQYWRWGQVDFEIIHPGERGDDRDNNQSCVLLIRFGDNRILLPGDIEASVEKQLLDSGRLSNPVAVLVAPHHGSQTSSSPRFVSALAPDHVVYSAGFNHHFGHPHVQVRARYRQQGSREWFTAASGALLFQWNEAGKLSVREQRELRQRYWYQQSTATDCTHSPCL